MAASVMSISWRDRVGRPSQHETQRHSARACSQEGACPLPQSNPVSVMASLFILRATLSPLPSVLRLFSLFLKHIFRILHSLIRNPIFCPFEYQSFLHYTLNTL